jgi:ABC-type glutathione transport system ATPase component
MDGGDRMKPEGTAVAGSTVSSTGTVPSEGAAASESALALDIDALEHDYPDGHRALDGVDLQVREGERVAILGPNGAGKTTLMLHLAGLLTATAGTVSVGGVEVGKKTLAEIRRRVGIVFQSPDDQLFMPTVADDVGFGPANLGLRGPELAARVTAALADVGLAAPRTTSRSASSAAPPSPASSPCGPTSSSATNPAPTSTRPAAATWRRSCTPPPRASCSSPTTCRTRSSCANGP